MGLWRGHGWGSSTLDVDISFQRGTGQKMGRRRTEVRQRIEREIIERARLKSEKFKATWGRQDEN